MDSHHVHITEQDSPKLEAIPSCMSVYKKKGMLDFCSVISSNFGIKNSIITTRTKGKYITWFKATNADSACYMLTSERKGHLQEVKENPCVFKPSATW